MSGKFQCCFKKFQRSFKEVSRVFKERVFHESFKGVTREIEGYFMGDISGFQGSLKELQREGSKVFQGCSRKFQWCSKKVSMVIQGRLKDV